MSFSLSYLSLILDENSEVWSVRFEFMNNSPIGKSTIKSKSLGEEEVKFESFYTQYLPPQFT